MKKRTLLTIAVLCLLAAPVLAKSYQYLSAAETSAKLQQQQPMVLVDIQVEKEFQQHHLPGALATAAYPVKSKTDLAKLDAILPQLQGTEPVVIVCPRGGGGAKRTYDYLEKKGVAAERLYILKKGQQGWPYPEQLAKN
jgi:thiosulfate/3-mercaptopyruvate sulfurtransferase